MHYNAVHHYNEPDQFNGKPNQYGSADSPSHYLYDYRYSGNPYRQRQMKGNVLSRVRVFDNAFSDIQWALNELEKRVRAITTVT